MTRRSSNSENERNDEGSEQDNHCREVTTPETNKIVLISFIPHILSVLEEVKFRRHFIEGDRKHDANKEKEDKAHGIRDTAEETASAILLASDESTDYKENHGTNNTSQGNDVEGLRGLPGSVEVANMLNILGLIRVLTNLLHVVGVGKFASKTNANNNEDKSCNIAAKDDKSLKLIRVTHNGTIKQKKES